MDTENIERSSLRRWAIVGVAILIALGVAAGALYSRTFPRIQQPLVFSHHLHVEESGLECTDCHLYVMSGERATIPNIEVCADCHDEAVGESDNELRLVEYVQSDQKIPWQKVYWVPSHVYFSHRRHTAVAGIACEECHGPIPTRTESIRREQPRITMARCTKCHEAMEASNDCISCHR